MNGLTMKFLNSGIRKFVKKGNYYTYGYDGQSVSVFMKDGRWSATVDHFATTQLFYSDNFISPSFKVLLLGIPCTTSSFIETHKVAGKPYNPLNPGFAPLDLINSWAKLTSQWRSYLK